MAFLKPGWANLQEEERQHKYIPSTHVIPTSDPVKNYPPALPL